MKFWKVKYYKRVDYLASDDNRRWWEWDRKLGVWKDGCWTTGPHDREPVTQLEILVITGTGGPVDWLKETKCLHNEIEKLKKAKLEDQKKIEVQLEEIRGLRNEIEKMKGAFK